MSSNPGAIGRYTPTRETVYRVLLSSQPPQEWTVRTLTDATGSKTTTSKVRDTIYMLIAAGAMTIVPGNQAITVRLNDAGLSQLQSIEKAWQNRPVARVPHRPAVSDDPVRDGRG
jgi:hypothetical protein